MLAAFGLGMARASRGLGALARVQRAALSGPVAPLVERGARLPTPGIRAGNAAPRPSPDEEVGDATVAMAVGLRGVHGLAIGGLEARVWGAGERLEGSGGSEADGECCLCSRAGGAAELAATGLPEGPAELCPPHAWLAVERAGAEAVRARLRPGLDLLAERIDASSGELTRAAPLFALGPFSFSTADARRARGRMATQLAPGRGCAICQAQLATEEAVEPAGPLCRPHLLQHPRVELEPTLARWREVVGALQEYIRKNDYRFRDEPRGPEQQSPWQAIALTAGARSVR